MKTQRTCPAKCPRCLFLLGLALLLAPAAGADDLTIQGDLIVTGQVTAASLETPSLSARQASQWDHRVTLFPTSGVGNIYLGDWKWMYVEEGGYVEAYGNWDFQSSVFAPRFESWDSLTFGLRGDSRVDFLVDSSTTAALSIAPGAGVFYFYNTPMLSFDESHLYGPDWVAEGNFHVGGVLHGDASGLTHLPAGNLAGTVPVANLPPEALEEVDIEALRSALLSYIAPMGDLSMGDFTSQGP